MSEPRLMPWFGGKPNDICLILDYKEREYLEIAVGLALAGHHTMTPEQMQWCEELKERLSVARESGEK